KSPDASNPKSWETGELATKLKFETDAAGKTKASAKLGAGIYRAILETQDRFGKPVTSRVQILVVDPAATKFAVKLPEHVAAAKWTLEPGQEFVALWGTGYDRGRAFIEIE